MSFSAEVDYTSISEELDIRQTLCEEIQVSADRVVENLESFQVSITSDDDSVIVTSRTVTININDATGEFIEFRHYVRTFQ